MGQSVQHLQLKDREGSSCSRQDFSQPWLCWEAAKRNLGTKFIKCPCSTPEVFPQESNPETRFPFTLACHTSRAVLLLAQHSQRGRESPTFLGQSVPLCWICTHEVEIHTFTTHDIINQEKNFILQIIVPALAL